MNLLMKLSARHLRLNKKRTTITIIGIALSIAMVTAISGFIVSFQDLLYRDAVDRDGLWNVQYEQLDAQTAEAVAAERVFSEHEIIETENGLTVRLQMKKLNQSIFDQSEAVCQKYGMNQEQVKYNKNLLIAKGIVPGNYYDALYTMAAVLLTLVGVASVLVISNAFAISAAERSRQFGLLKSVGATAKQIRSSVLFEGAILAIFAVPLGFFIGLFTEWVALSIANAILGRMDSATLLVLFRVVVSGWMLLAAFAAAMIVIFFAAWLPARRASRQSPIDAIRQTAVIRVRPKDVRVSPFSKLFGFEGILAAKTMKRSRGRYRATVISLVVSIVLFIGVSSFGQLFFQAAGMVYEDYGSNVLIQLHGEDKKLQDELASEIASWDGAETMLCRITQGTANLPDSAFTETATQVFGVGNKQVRLYSLSDAAFAALCESIRLNPAELESVDNPKAILVNTTGTHIQQGRRYNFTPFRFSTGERIAVETGGASTPLTIVGITEEIPKDILPQFYSDNMNLIVSESVRASMQPSNMTDWLNIAVMASDANAFEQQADEFLAPRLGDNTYFLSNFEEQAADTRNMGLLIMIFVNGFIALLTLIGVTNLVTTISTGIALRRREFAMLRSLGMTQDKLGKSLLYESLIYGVKSLIIGIPLGLLASRLMYNALDLAMSFEYIWPVQSTIISIIAVIALVFCTIHVASNKQRRENMVDALQNEVV